MTFIPLYLFFLCFKTELAVSKKKVEEVKEWLYRIEKFQVEESFKNLSSTFLERGFIGVVYLRSFCRWNNGNQIKDGKFKGVIYGVKFAFHLLLNAFDPVSMRISYFLFMYIQLQRVVP